MEATERARWLKKLRGTATPLKLAGRTGTVQGAFWKAVSPHDEFDDEQLAKHLATFLREDIDPQCVYCGGEANEWDHLMPSRERDAAQSKRKKFTGFGSLLSNLVPACGKCNHSKGSKRWREWLKGESAHARRARGRPGHKERVRQLAALERRARRDYRAPPEETATPLWIEYEKVLKSIADKLRRADKLAASIRAAARSQS